MHPTELVVTVRQPMRMSLAGVVIAIVAMVGLMFGPAPQQARAALVATGVNDSYTVKHDRATTIPAPGVLGNDLNLLGGSSAILASGVSWPGLTPSNTRETPASESHRIVLLACPVTAWQQ